jgi:hypothetical protein
MRSVDLSKKPKKYWKWYSVVRKDITRCDYKRTKKRKDGSVYEEWTHGWWVRINWKGVKYQKMFHDHHSVGPVESLWRAKEWRKRKYAEIGKPLTHKVIQTSESNGLGRGLRHNPRWKQIIKKGGKEFIYYRNVIQISWPKGNGKHGASNISVAKHGYEKAVKIAEKIVAEKYEKFYETKTYDSIKN